MSVGPVRSPVDCDRQNLAVTFDQNLLQCVRRMRPNVIERLGEAFQGAFAHLLTGNAAIVSNTEQHNAATLVRHPADRLRGTLVLGGRLLELDRWYRSRSTWV